MLNNSRDSKNRGIYQDNFLLLFYLFLELYIKYYKLQRLNEIK